MTAPLIDEWWGLYGRSLASWIAPAAFKHPAKFSRKLIERIYAHCLEEGWLQPGQRVLDPMAGVAVGGVAAANAGLAWEGIELETHFLEAGRATLERHRHVWEQMSKPLPVLRQGDAQLLGQAKRDEAHAGGPPGQIGALPVGDVQAVITSPPYVGGGSHPDQTGSWGRLNIEKAIGLGTKDAAGYGQTPGQVGRMPEGEIQTGNQTRETYWAAMRAVYAGCFALLPPGGHLVLVLKGYVRKGRFVDLPGQTCQLLEAVGFQVLHRHRAWLVAKEAQGRLDGGMDRREYKSFFRQIQERRGGSRVDFEEVVCAEKTG